MARLLRYIHPHVSRYAQVDVPSRQTIIRRNRVELFLTVTLTNLGQLIEQGLDHHFYRVVNEINLRAVEWIPSTC
jgi:hypothetical protein